MSTLLLFWDESHLWGLLAARAARQMGIEHVIARAGDVPTLLRRCKPAVFLVPGGNARHKGEALGNDGRQAVREYVASGGQYMGFCGGAGLALSWKGGLGICPWQRAGFDDRLQHFMSGHLIMRLPAAQSHPFLYPGNFSASPALPVWWPGRFDAAPLPGMTVLATYQEPDNDFWLADLPIASIPTETFEIWQNLYDFSVTPTFLQGQPCVVYGTFGKGAYTITYSHLETPDSPDANAWLGHLLREMAGLRPQRDRLPVWDTWQTEPVWEGAELDELEQLIAGVLKTGIEHGLLFQRNTWLIGWRTGIAGASLNNLWSLLKVIREMEPSDAAWHFWKEHKDTLLEAAHFFHSGCIQYLLAERLGMTLNKSMPEALPPSLLRQQRTSLFGPPMQAGGVYKDLIHPLDELAYLQISATRHA